MLNTNSIHELSQSTWHGEFRFPLYTGHSFYCLPNTIKALFSLPRGIQSGPTLPENALGFALNPNSSNCNIRHVVLILVDAFGWTFWERFLEMQNHSAMELEKQGVLSALSSCFPSTTSLHVTAISSGQCGGESGIYEWQIYDPQLNSIITPLPFTLAGKNVAEPLTTAGLNTAQVFPSSTIYEELSQQGVKCSVIQDSSFCDSLSSRALGKGAERIPSSGFRNSLEILNERIQGSRSQSTYTYVYYHPFDYLCHQFGPRSTETINEGIFVIEEIERFISSLRRSAPKGETLVLVTADHGQTDVDPNATVYINHSIPGIVNILEHGANGKPLAPLGSARDMFLKVKAEHLEEGIDLLTKNLSGIAEVHAVSNLIEQGFFGPKISQTFLSRVGNVVILPYAGQTVWWYEKDNFEMTFFGHHGGLTPNEITSALLSIVI